MKKIFLFLSILSLLHLTSCSKDGGTTETKFVKITINGTERVFKNITKTETTFVDPDTGESYIDIDVLATLSDDPNTYVEFSFGKDAIGPDVIYYLAYADENGYYGPTNFSSAMAENNATVISGTFSGTFTDAETGTSITITNGRYDIR